MLSRMLASQQQNRTSLAEETVEMTRLEENGMSKSWLLRSESEDEGASDEEMQHHRMLHQLHIKMKNRQRLDDSVGCRSCRKLWCCRLFCCCSRSTCKVIMLVMVMILSFLSFGMNIQASTCWTPRDELLLLTTFNQASANGKEGPWPLTIAHSHNDYLQALPLKQALMAGFCSVEGDVFLIGDTLQLGHAVATSMSLEDIYLKPLIELVKSNGGFVYKRAKKLGTCLQVTVLVDIKSAQENIQTWLALEGILERLDTFLEDGRPIIETFDAQGKVVGSDKSPLPSPIRVVVTGVKGAVDEIATKMIKMKQHKTSLDLNAESTVPLTLSMSRWISENWPYKETINDTSTIKGVRDRVLFAQKYNLRVRYWNTPDNPKVWQFLLDNGVDMINTDAVFTLHTFLTGKTLGKLDDDE